MLDRCAKFIIYPVERCCYFKSQSHSTHLTIGRAINRFKQEARGPPSAGEHCMKLLLIMCFHLQSSHVKLHRHKKYVCTQTALTFPSVPSSPACPDHAALPSTCKSHSFSKASFLAVSTSNRPETNAPGVNCLCHLQRAFLPMTAWVLFWGRKNALKPCTTSH